MPSLMPWGSSLAASVMILNIIIVEVVTQCWWMACQWSQPAGTGHTRVAVVADPQLTDRTSYEFASSGTALWVVRYLCDTYLKRAFSMVRSLRPEAVVFMGDLMDGARSYDSKEYALEYERFREIARMRPGTPEFHVAGNHDIGLGHSFCAACAQRFTDKMGPLSYKVSLGNVTFIAVDTVSTAGNIDAFSCMAHRRFRRASHSFTSKVSHSRVSLDWRGVTETPAPVADASFQGEMDCRPRILLTHIPLFRPEGTHCGLGRAKGNGFIRYLLRFTFQTTVAEDLSAVILEATRPDLVLSGDDHDQCHVEHPAPWRGVAAKRGWSKTLSGIGVEERTVGTVSMLQGNIYPSIALLTLDQVAASQRVQSCKNGQGVGFGDSVVDYKVCMLPPQLMIYYWSAGVAGFCLAGLLLWHVCTCHLVAKPIWKAPLRMVSAVLFSLWDAVLALTVSFPIFLAIRVLGDSM